MPIVMLVTAAFEPDEEFERALGKRGLETIRVCTGAEAEASLRRVGPDVIVVRDPLPRPGAIRWIESLRAGGCHRPVVYRSPEELSEESRRRLTRELGVCLVLREPAAPALIADQVAGLVGPMSRSEAAAPANFAREMAALRDEYTQTLPARLEELSEAVRLAREDAHDPERSRRVQALAHALCGTAGTFGLRDFSRAAGRIENASRRLREPDTASASPLVEMEEALAAALASLEQGG